jgi:hypothetical protein
MTLGEGAGRGRRARRFVSEDMEKADDRSTLQAE